MCLEKCLIPKNSFYSVYSQIPAGLGSLSEKFSKFLDSVKKIEDFGRQFLVKTGVFG